MNLLYLRRRLFLAAVVCLVCGLFAFAGDEPNLTKEQIKQFLVTAKVVKSQQAKKGITNTSRLTLSDGTITHDASFQPIDEHKAEMQACHRYRELNFVDSYKYNIAAYALAELIGHGRHAAGIRRTQMGRQDRLAQLVVAGEDG